MAPKHFVLVAKFLGKSDCWCIANFAFDGALRQLNTHATFVQPYTEHFTLSIIITFYSRKDFKEKVTEVELLFMFFTV